jgi:hypothetical protein
MAFNTGEPLVAVQASCTAKGVVRTAKSARQCPARQRCRCPEPRQNYTAKALSCVPTFALIQGPLPCIPPFAVSKRPLPCTLSLPCTAALCHASSRCRVPSLCRGAFFVVCCPSIRTTMPQSLPCATRPPARQNHCQTHSMPPGSTG